MVSSSISDHELPPIKAVESHHESRPLATHHFVGLVREAATRTALNLNTGCTRQLADRVRRQWGTAFPYATWILAADTQRSE